MIVLAAAFLLCQPGGATNEPAKPVVTLPAATVIRSMRASYQKHPTAERVGVTLTREGRTPMSATLTLRIAPGARRDAGDAVVSIEAGDLRVIIDGEPAREGVPASEGKPEQPARASTRRVVAVLGSNPHTYFEAPMSGAPSPESIGAALGGEGTPLPPFPLPQLTLLTSNDDRFDAPVAHTPGVAWKPVTLAPDDPPGVLTLHGSGTFGDVTLSADTKTDRVVSFSGVLPNLAGAEAKRTIAIVVRGIEPGDPATWNIDTRGRTRVGSLHQLVEKPKPADAPKQTPATTEPPAEKPGSVTRGA